MIIDFKKYSSIKIGPKLDVAVLEECVKFDGFIVGGANNLLVSNKALNLGILGGEFDFIKILDQNNDFVLLEIGCATNSAKLYKFALENDLQGFEFLRKIPGKLGGLLRMNAGVKNDEISENLISVSIFNDEIRREEMGFSYRNCECKEVFFKAKFKLKKGFDFSKDEALKSMRSNQPSGASFGSIFKNPPNDFAGRLIEAVGLKGEKKGGAMISDKHANFLINTGKASFEDAIFLISLAKNRVFEHFGIRLVEEVIVI